MLFADAQVKENLCLIVALTFGILACILLS